MLPNNYSIDNTVNLLDKTPKTVPLYKPFGSKVLSFLSNAYAGNALYSPQSPGLPGAPDEQRF
jgi:hypothetical protein